MERGTWSGKGAGHTEKRMKVWKIIGIVIAAVLACAILFVVIAVIGFGGGHYRKDGTYRRATWKSSVAWTMQHPAFAEYGRFLLPWQEGAASVTVPPMSYFWMCLTTNWNTSDVVSGINFMIEREEADGAHFYHYYTQEEIAEDAAKAETGLIYIPGDADKPFAFVVPGGGMTSEAITAEGFTAARELHAQGYPVFIVKYRVSTQRPMEEQEVIANRDFGKALQSIFANAAELGVRTEGYSVWGYSAGGRLCYLWGLDNEYGYTAYGLPAPAMSVLVYSGWHEARFAEDYQTVPPTFFSYSRHDAVIGRDNVLAIEEFIAKLGREGIRTEVRAYNRAPHGYGTGAGTEADGWMKYAYAFWEQLLADRSETV